MEKEVVAESLRKYKERRDYLLHEDTNTFGVHLSGFIEFCDRDEIIQSVLQPILSSHKIDVTSWWKRLDEDEDAVFPSDEDECLALRYQLMKDVGENYLKLYSLAYGVNKSGGLDVGVSVFRSIIFRPFASEFSHRLEKAVNLATPEERALQAIPLQRIPGATEIKIFLSHKSIDKPLVMRYYKALKELGFDPWLDDPDMPAGTNLERGLVDGFVKSCAAVFFITDNFRDENFLASEVEYAVAQKRKKNKKFAIITLHYSNASPIPDLLTPYIYKNIDNDLDGFYEIVRALPIELGQSRWKEGVE